MCQTRRSPTRSYEIEDARAVERCGLRCGPALPFVRRGYEAPLMCCERASRPARFAASSSSGLAFRQKLTTEGARQIVSIHMAGDFLDLQHLFLNRADHSVQALTRIDAPKSSARRFSSWRCGIPRSAGPCGPMRWSMPRSSANGS